MCDQLANIEFVREVEKHPELYDYTLPGYSRRADTDRAWDEIAAKFNMRADQCRDKWKNIRTVCARRFKPGGSGVKKAYYLTEYIQFAIPFLNSKKRSSSVHLQDYPENEDSSEVHQEHDITTPDPDDCDEQITTPTLLDCPPSSLEPASSSSAQGRETEFDFSLGKRRRLTAAPKAEFEDDHLLAANFSAENSNVESQLTVETVMADRREEGLKLFLLSLLPDLALFSDVQVRAFKRKVLAVVDEIAEPPVNSFTSSMKSV